MDDQERFIAFLADIERAKRLVQVTTEARVESAEVRAQQMTQPNQLQSLYYLIGIGGALIIIVAFVLETRSEVQGVQRQVSSNQEYNREEQARLREYTKEMEARIRALENGGVRSK